jgi:DNA-binding response OmpR family regulator
MPKILIVEDDDTQRLLYCRELSKEGYAADAAANGPAALRQFALNPPDVVILDIRMPGVDGIGLLASFIAKDSCVPIILHSAYACYRDNYLSWAADAYLTKCSDLTELKCTVKALLAARRSRTRVADSVVGNFILAGQNDSRRGEWDPAEHDLKKTSDS